ACQLTPGNLDDRKPVPFLSKSLFGKLFADKGYISQDLFARLFQKDIQLITGIRKNMQNRLMPWADKLLLRKRSIIETINDQIKNISQIEHSRHRSFVNFLVNLIAGLIAYCLQPKKPSLHIHNDLPATIY
ncbi:MAG TPA: IS982 family transposase, partial [Anaerolineales bacterium]|nr:IS982 family transposase [Anaerolineales bacterium]